MAQRTALLALALAQLPLSRAGCLDEFASCADSRIFAVGEVGTCGYEIKEEDVNPGCGGAEFPCAAGALGILWGYPKCNECVKMTLIEPGSTNPAVCVGGVCPAYEEDVYLKAIDSTSAATFQASQVGWKVACPFVCNGSTVCVKDPSVCALGAREGENAHCSSGYKEIRWAEVECGDSGAKGDEGRGWSKAAESLAVKLFTSEASVATETEDEDEVEVVTPTVGNEAPTPTVGNEAPTPTVGNEAPTPTVGDEEPTKTVADEGTGMGEDEGTTTSGTGDDEEGSKGTGRDEATVGYSTIVDDDIGSKTTTSTTCAKDCVHNHNCDESEWCDQCEIYHPYCATIDQDMPYCPEPYCKWATCDDSESTTTTTTKAAVTEEEEEATPTPTSLWSSELMTTKGGGQSTTSTTKSDCPRKCIHNDDCSQSQWCRDDDNRDYCYEQQVNGVDCPTPRCKLGECDDGSDELPPGASSRVTSSFALLAGAAVAPWLLA